MIFKRIESRFGRKIPKSALFYPEKLSQSFWRFLVCYAELIGSHYSRLVRHFCFPDTINLRMRGEKLVPVGREFKLVDFHDSLGHLLCLFLQRLYILKFEGICGIIYDVGQTDKSEFGGGVNEYSK